MMNNKPTNPLTAYSHMAPYEKMTDKTTNAVISKHLPGILETADVYLDISQATDIVVWQNLSNTPLQIAKRVRSYDAFLQWPDQFTLRNAELTKVLSGKADFMFYFFFDEAWQHVLRYHIINFDLFRMEYNEYKALIQHNADGSTFHVFPTYKFPLAVSTY